MSKNISCLLEMESLGMEAVCDGPSTCCHCHLVWHRDFTVTFLKNAYILTTFKKPGLYTQRPIITSLGLSLIFGHNARELSPSRTTSPSTSIRISACYAAMTPFSPTSSAHQGEVTPREK